jgi:ribosomal protein S27AE
MLHAVHRDVFHSCPRCGCGLDADHARLHCGQCNGMFVPEQELLDEISGEQARTLLKPRTDWLTGAQVPFVAFVHELGPEVVTKEVVLTCPRCAVAMTKHALFGIVLDRCVAHGVWVDNADELRTIIAAAVAGL